MFEYTLAHWSAFFTAAVLLNLSPGPDLAFILGQTTRLGWRSGVAAMTGVWVGAFSHVILAAVGISTILAASAIAFTTVKWVGAAYLIWLGVRAWLATGETPDAAVSTSKDGFSRSIFLQGVLVAALNPKVAIFFLAFLPQFVVPGAGAVGWQLFLHGSLVIGVAAIVEPIMVFFASTASSSMRNNPKVAMWLDRLLGTLFVGLGLRLIMSKQHV